MNNASVSEEATLADLLSQWQRSRAEGKEMTPDELCRGHPALLPELHKRIAALQQMDALIGDDCETLTVDTLNDPRSSDAPPDAAEIPGYEILAELGRGGMGVVYKARQISLNRVVALKMILSGPHAGSEAMARFLREAETIAGLRHPHVVQVHEFGSHQGKPFFSLEYLEGGSLAEKLRGEPQPPLQAAQIVELLATAVQEAHSQGIVHRDLKPANVLLTADGIPKLTDFGVAKKSDSGMTATGQVLGTPSYMAPEQAGGKAKRVGPAADIYALGAILYELLTGRPPFKGASVWDTLQMVVGMEPVPPRRLQPKVPRDLEIICLKCLHKEPARRYDSALALADDLHRFRNNEPIQARPVGRIERGWRWCGRNRLTAALAALLSVALAASLVALTALWLLAERKREEIQREQELTSAARNEALANLEQANANFALARQAVDRHFTEVSEDELLKEPGLQRLRKKLLQASREFYQRFIEQRKNDPELRMGLAAAYDRLAAITDAIDAKDKAVAHQREAIRLYEELCEEDRANKALSYHLSHSYFNLGNLYFAMDQVGSAEAAFRRSLDLIEPLAASDASSSAFAEQMVLALDGLGRLLAQKKGNLVEAEKRFTQALQVARVFSAAHPQSADKFSTAMTLRDLAILYTDIQRAEKAVPLLEQARGLLLELTKRVPAKPEHLSSLAACLNSLAVSLRQVGRASDAEKTYLQAAAAWKDLSRKNPLVASYQASWAIVCYNLGNLYGGDGRVAKAEEAYKQAREIQERLTVEFPTLAQAKRDLSETYSNLAGLYSHLGRRDEAERMHGKVLDIREQLCKNHPDTLEFHELLGKSLGSLAAFYSDAGQAAKAEANYRRKITILQRLIEKSPQKPAYRCSLGLTYNDLGRLFRPLGRFQDAESAYGTALTIQEDLLREQPRSTDYRVDVATTQNNLGSLYISWNKKDKVEDYYRKAIRGHETLVRDYPRASYFRQELARSYNGLGSFFCSVKRPAEAEPLIRQAADLYGKLAEEQPAVLNYHKQHFQALLNLCEIYHHTKRNAEAESLCKKSLPMVERMAHQYPKYLELSYQLGLAQRLMGEALSGAQEDNPEAIPWYNRSILTLNRVARKSPQDVRIRHALAAAYTERFKLLLQNLRPSAALRDLARARELNPQLPSLPPQAQGVVRDLAKDHAGNAAKAEELASKKKASAFLVYNAACVHACSAAAVREDGKLTPPAKDQLTERYLNRSLEWLRKAQAAGYFTDAPAVEGLKSESDLAPLRKRDDYKKWLSGLEKESSS